MDFAAWALYVVSHTCKSQAGLKLLWRQSSKSSRVPVISQESHKSSNMNSWQSTQVSTFESVVMISWVLFLLYHYHGTLTDSLTLKPNVGRIFTLVPQRASLSFCCSYLCSDADSNQKQEAITESVDARNVVDRWEDHTSDKSDSICGLLTQLLLTAKPENKGTFIRAVSQYQ